MTQFKEKTDLIGGSRLVPQSITEYFQQEVKPLRSLAEIKADILILEESSLEPKKKVFE